MSKWRAVQRPPWYLPIALFWAAVVGFDTWLHDHIGHVFFICDWADRALVDDWMVMEWNELIDDEVDL